MLLPMQVLRRRLDLLMVYIHFIPRMNVLSRYDLLRSCCTRFTNFCYLQSSTHTLDYPFTSAPPEPRDQESFGLDTRGRLMLVPFERFGEMVQNMGTVYVWGLAGVDSGWYGWCKYWQSIIWSQLPTSLDPSASALMIFADTYAGDMDRGTPRYL